MSNLVILSIIIQACIWYSSADFCDVVEKFKKFETTMETYLADRDVECDAMKRHFDCSRIHEDYPMATDGVYSVHPVDGGRPFQVYCDMTNDGGGWLVIQRHAGLLDFNKKWMEYKEGFGDIQKDFWLGNDKISRLTKQGKYELRIEMIDSKNRTGFAEYNNFRVGDMSSFYKLNVEGYSGNTGDSLSRHNGMRFSASDLDVDQNQRKACGAIYKSGWWFNSCLDSNLNGDRNSTLWTTWSTEPLVMSVMKIRPAHRHDELGSTNFPTDGEDCQDILDRRPGAVSGVYTVGLSDGGDKFKVYCDMVTDGGGWVVFQKRFDGSEYFYRTWNEYKDGFGHLTSEFWLGNGRIHRLTAYKANELRVDLTDRNNDKAYAKYGTFNIANASDLYRLTVGDFSGTAGDSLIAAHNGYVFSTKDNDSTPVGCSKKSFGAWWYSRCHNSNLNGMYNDDKYAEGLTWNTYRGQYESLKATSMKIRPRV